MKKSSDYQIGNVVETRFGLLTKTKETGILSAFESYSTDIWISFDGSKYIPTVKFENGDAQEPEFVKMGV
jgi:hypothetical protein